MYMCLFMSAQVNMYVCVFMCVHVEAFGAAPEQLSTPFSSDTVPHCSGACCLDKASPPVCPEDSPVSALPQPHPVPGFQVLSTMPSAFHGF